MSNSLLPKISFIVDTDISEYFRSRSAQIDKGELLVDEGLQYLFGSDPVMVEKLSDNGDLKASHRRITKVGQAMASVAYEDMTSAFCSWCHRMTLEYLYQASARSDDSSTISGTIEQMKKVSVLGSTALGAGTANFLIGTPLPVEAVENEHSLTLNGEIRWASNLTGDFVMVTAASLCGSDEKVLVAIPGGSFGLNVNDHMRILGLQQTFSTSVKIEDLEVQQASVVTRDFGNFMETILPAFLILQSSFCKGLAARSLEESENLITGQSIVFKDDYVDLVDEFNDLAGRLSDDQITTLGKDQYIRELLRIRLAFAQTAAAAANLELKLQGGKAYATASASSRRFREAAFLPIQAPTEVQLRWILSQ